MTPSITPTPQVKIPHTSMAQHWEAKLTLVKQFLSTLERPPDLSDEEYQQFIWYCMDYSLVRKKLFWKTRSSRAQLVPEQETCIHLIKYAHDHLGHKGVFTTTRNILVHFWWPHMNEDIRWWIRTCHKCQVWQTKYFHIPPVVPEVPYLFRKAHINTFLMPKLRLYRYVLHVQDALTSYPKGHMTTSDSAKVIANFIFQDILCWWGALANLVTDNTAPYIAALDILASWYSICHIRISGYNSQVNGIIESKHFNVWEAIMKTCKGIESKWREVLPLVFWAKQVTIRKSTGYSPYFMVHSTHPLLPFDILEATYLSPPQDFGLSTEELISLHASQLAKRPGDIEWM